MAISNAISIILSLEYFFLGAKLIPLFLYVLLDIYQCLYKKFILFFPVIQVQEKNSKEKTNSYVN